MRIWSRQFVIDLMVLIECYVPWYTALQLYTEPNISQINSATAVHLLWKTMDYWIFRLWSMSSVCRGNVFPHSEVEVTVFWSFLLPEPSAQDGLDEFINTAWRQRRDVCTLSTIATWRKFRSLYKYEDHINSIHSKVTSYGFRSSLMYAFTLRIWYCTVVLNNHIPASIKTDL